MFRLTGKDRNGLVIADAATGAMRTLTTGAAHDNFPSWSPKADAWSGDGEWIVFTSARSGFKDESALHPFNPQPYGDLYVMRVDGSDVRMLTDDQFEDGTPSWIPAKRR